MYNNYYDNNNNNNNSRNSYIKDVEYSEIQQMKNVRGSYPQDIINKGKLLASGDYGQSLFKKNDASFKMGGVGAISGLLLALYLRKRILIFAVAGALVGIGVGNLIFRNKDKSE